MKRTITILLVLISIWSSCFAQSSIRNNLFNELAVTKRDSLFNELAVAKQDTNRVWLLYWLTGTYRFNQPDSAIYYGMKGLKLAREINFPAGEVAAMRFLAISHISLGNYSKAMQIDLVAIRLAEENNLPSEKRILLAHLGDIYQNTGDYPEAMRYYKASVSLTDSAREYGWYIIILNDIGETYIKMEQIDSAKYYIKMAHKYSDIHKGGNDPFSLTLTNLGKIYQLEGNKEMALSFFRHGLLIHSSVRHQFLRTFPLAEFYFETNDLDSSAFYARKSLNIAIEGHLYKDIVQSSNLLSAIYKHNDLKKALEYKEMAMAYQDSLFSLGRKAAIQNYMDFDVVERQQEINEVKAKLKNRLRMNAFLGSTFTLFIIAIFLFILSRRKQKAKQKIESAFNQLKATQSQLIQSEKMASLGELTAGIAHEIQNPLNFVNNFSEVSNELIDEMKEEFQKGDIDEGFAIADDIKQNLEKINHHGKRADAIVKGMLQHSRTSTGQMELTDINALADEYLRLAYHGMRAKDKSFNADFKTEFDETLPKINVIPQDIGRVLLNLINNAFYAVDKRAKENTPQPPEGGAKNVQIKYSPTVTISTTSSKSPSGDLGVKVVVKDNGNGIPSSIVDKIFQPFFTTKPTGQGTGLGLSLSYDIVKAHGGEIKVESKEGEGTEFIIQIPTN